MKKKLWLMLCLLVCICCVGIYGNSTLVLAESTELSQEDIAYYKEFAETNMNSWSAFNFESNVKEQGSLMDSETLEQYTQWAELQKELGELVSIEETEVVQEGSVIKIITNAIFTNSKVVGTITADQVAGTSNFQIEKAQEKTSGNFGDKMEKAGLNTLMGMGIVLISLFVISIVIGLFKYIPKIVEKFQKKQEVIEETPAENIDHTIAAIVEQETEELVDDLELVAVVTAAIMASMGEEVPADGLVVRSIKRRSSNKWQNA